MLVVVLVVVLPAPQIGVFATRLASPRTLAHVNFLVTHECQAYDRRASKTRRTIAVATTMQMCPLFLGSRQSARRRFHQRAPAAAAHSTAHRGTRRERRETLPHQSAAARLAWVRSAKRALDFNNNKKPHFSCVSKILQRFQECGSIMPGQVANLKCQKKKTGYPLY